MRATVLAALIVTAAGGANAQSLEPGAAAATAQAPEPGLGLREAQIVGAAAGLALGAVLAARPSEGSVPALTPLGGADAVVAGSAVTLYVTAEILARRPPDAAASAPIAEINGFDRKIRSFAVGRRSLEKRLLLDHISSATLMAAVTQPVGILIGADVPDKWSRDLPVLAEATALTLSVNAFVKHLTHRSRPAAHFCESEKTVVPCPPDTRLSFYSGHTSAAFVAAVAAGTLADFHHLENRKWIWASGLTFATATGVLRVTADQHYATDVLTGIVAGSLAGWLIPKLHEPDPAPAASSAVARPPPAPAAAVPVVIASGRSTAVVTVGSAGGGPYVSVHWRW